MFPYQKFLIKDTDRFDPHLFPQLEESLQETLAQLDKTPGNPSTAMIISFAKDHCMDAQLVKEHPQLAGQIHSNELPLMVMSQLFESSRQNLAYRKSLEAYVTAYLSSGKPPPPVF